MILSITCVAAALSLFYALSLPDKYRATVVLAPIEATGGSLLQKSSGQFAGLASFAGLQSTTRPIDKTVIGIEILTSWGFIENFIEKNNMAPEIVAVEGWDKSTNRLTYNLEIYDNDREHWKNKSSIKEGDPPSSWELYKAFNSILTIEKDNVTGFYKVSIEHYSPVLAANWVEQLIQELNSYLREIDANEVIKKVSYLKEQASKTEIAGMQSVFFTLIEEQTKRLMLTETMEEYVFQTVVKARVPEERYKPKRSLICLSGTLIGFLFSVCIVFICSLLFGKFNSQQ